MSEARSFASLSSGLLARKGAAKPAMRPQGFNQMGVSLEDLGWNDMGHSPAAPVQEEPAERVPSSVAALTPVRAVEPVEDPVPPPTVVEQQRAIETHFAEAAPASKPAPARPAAKAEVVTLRTPRAAAGAKPKAAFTLRLEEQRHLKLRLACAVTRRSAQQIVTEALDDFLSNLPELDTMVGHVPAKFGKRQ